MSIQTVLLRVSLVLWLIWGGVHILAGVMTMTQDIPGAIGGIADAVDPASLQMVYPDAVGGIIKHHGFNLFWIGLATIVGGLFIGKGSATGIFCTAAVGGFADLGYFLFLDLGGFVHFIPGTLMTIISASAILTSFLSYFKYGRGV